MRVGRRLGIDVGAVRVGVAVCDAEGLIATPVESVPRDLAGGADLARIEELAAQFAVIEVVVGLPVGLGGSEGAAAAKAREYAAALARRLPRVRVCLVDERLSTVAAHRDLHAAGRPMNRHRAVVDQQAAVLILETALQTERSTGTPPGEPLQSRKPRAARRRR